MTKTKKLNWELGDETARNQNGKRTYADINVGEWFVFADDWVDGEESCSIEKVKIKTHNGWFEVSTGGVVGHPSIWSQSYLSQDKSIIALDGDVKVWRRK
jgi:hypothetical protein